MPYTDESVQNLIINKMPASVYENTTPVDTQVYVVTDPAGKNMDNISETGYKVLNSTNGMEAGAICNDKRIFKDIIKYAHSTFDGSEFIVVGNPVVSNDGILKPVASNYETFYLPIPVNNGFKAMVKFNTGSLTGSHAIGLLNTTPIQVYIQCLGSPSKFYLEARIADSSNNYTIRISSTELSANTDYIATFAYNHTDLSVNLKLYDADFNLLDSNAATSGSNIIISNETVLARVGDVNADVANLSIDLKYLSIWFDDKLTFSGSKTDIDIIKSDNYAFVGAPTITDDGIASLLTTSNYITSLYPNSNSFTLKCNFLWNGTNPTGSASLYQVRTSNSQEQFDIYLNTSGKIALSTKVSGTSHTDFSVISISANSMVSIIAEKTESSITVKAYQNGSLIYNEVQASNIPTFDSTSSMRIGASTYAINGSIDLNLVQVYVGGNLVYQPCLKIPYVQSDVGSKVVEANYRARVSNMYEQYGYAPYYTIDEANQDFSLPSGNIYGMIETSVKNDTDYIISLPAVQDTGEVVHNEEGIYERLNEDAHSTFDVSKFTIAGSPSISNKGIISGFSASNFVSIPAVALDATSDIKIYCRVNMQEGASVNNFIWCMGGYTSYPALMINGGGITYFYGGAESNNIKKTGTTIKLNTDYDILVHYNFGTINLYYKLASDSYYEFIGTATIASDYSFNNTIYIGAPSSVGSWFFHGSLDLKYFYIKTNGLDTFSCTQKGVDIIKSDDYTITGMLTISNDGMASGFSGSSYITTSSIALNATDDIKVYSRFILTGTSQQNGIWSMGTYQTRPALLANANSIRIFLGGSESNNIIGSGLTINLNTPYDVLVHFNKGTAYLYYKLSFASSYTLLGTKDLDSEYSYDYPLTLGNPPATNDWYLHGYADLNFLRVYKNDQLIYQSCLRVPYINSFDDKKMVDFLYESRVADTYEQFGQAPYVILNDTDKSYQLPRGSVYGLIGRRILRDSYKNGMDYWELYSDRTLEQGGSCTSGTEVTFIKPFIDTNYVLTVPYSAKTATGFTPSQTGDWIAKGIGNL